MSTAIGLQPIPVSSAGGNQRPPPPPRYLGPERRQQPRDPGNWLVRMLDEIDYGMLAVGADAELRYLNHAARRELDGEHPLQLAGKNVRAQLPQDVPRLHEALAGARRGLRKLVTLGQDGHRVSISVVPLAGSAEAHEEPLTLLMLGKRQVCEHLPLRGFARSVGLTDAETRVLEQLCAGQRPADIARAGGVKIATVRTQIGTARAKTGAGSIREMISMVALLPPLVGALRCGGQNVIAALIGFGLMQ